MDPRPRPSNANSKPAGRPPCALLCRLSTVLPSSPAQDANWGAGRESWGSQLRSYSAVSCQPERPGMGQCPLPLLPDSPWNCPPQTPTLPSLLGGIVMVVIAASSLLCLPRHSHHHLPHPLPPPNICAFQRLSRKIYCQTTLAFHWARGYPLARTLAPAPPQNPGPYNQYSLRLADWVSCPKPHFQRYTRACFLMCLSPRSEIHWVVTVNKIQDTRSHLNFR